MAATTARQATVAGRVPAGRPAIGREQFLFLVQRSLDRGKTVEESVRRVADVHPLEARLATEALHRGLYEVALENLGSAERARVVRLVVVSRQESGTETREITIRRSALRDWPVFTLDGARKLEACTVEEGRWAVAQMDATIRGVQRRRDVIARLVAKAEVAGVAILGELSDDEFDECVEGVV